MLIIPGQPGKDVCDRDLGMTRRDLMRVGGSCMLGLTLGNLFELQAASAASSTDAGKAKSEPGWGKAKSIILIY
jgi:hypothetical protein